MIYFCSVLRETSCCLFEKTHPQSDVIEAFNSNSRYLDDLLNIYNNFFDRARVGRPQTS